MITMDLKLIYRIVLAGQLVNYVRTNPKITLEERNRLLDVALSVGWGVSSTGEEMMRDAVTANPIRTIKISEADFTLAMTTLRNSRTEWRKKAGAAKTQKMQETCMHQVTFINRTIAALDTLSKGI